MFSKILPRRSARLNFVGKIPNMIPFTCELNEVNIATKAESRGARQAYYAKPRHG